MSGKFCVAAVVAIIAALQISGNVAIPVGKENKNADDDSIKLISRVLFDFTSHVLQTGKVALAMVDSSRDVFPFGRPYLLDFTKEVCSMNNTDCETFQEQITIGGYDEDSEYQGTTYLIGLQGNDVRLDFNPNNFSYEFVVPNFGLTSFDYQRNITNLNTSSQMVYGGLELKIVDSRVGISGDFEFSEGHYIVSNVTVLLELGEVSMKIPTVSKFENGTWTDLAPIEDDAAPMVMELWRGTDDNGVTLEKRYSAYLEEKINDILAGRSTF